VKVLFAKGKIAWSTLLQHSIFSGNVPELCVCAEDNCASCTYLDVLNICVYMNRRAQRILE